MNTPWWYSGDGPAGEVPPPESDSRARDAADAPAWDPNALLLAANQIVDWATERFIAPHAEHLDPREHPTCVLCRSAAMLGSITVEPPVTADEPTPMTWIPVRRMNPEE